LQRPKIPHSRLRVNASISRLRVNASISLEKGIVFKLLPDVS